MARMSVRRALTYRAEWLFGVLRQVAALWIQLAIWRALLANGVADTGAGTITLADMVTYLIVVNVVMAVVHQRLSYDVEARLRNGTIALDLLKPVGLAVIALGRSLGESSSAFVSRLLPALLVVALIWGIQLPASAAAAVGFVAAILVGACIAYALGFLLATLGFRVWSTEHFEWLLGLFVRVVSGAVIPFWFLPDWVKRVGELLPFHMMGFTPSDRNSNREPERAIGRRHVRKHREPRRGRD